MGERGGCAYIYLTPPTSKPKTSSKNTPFAPFVMSVLVPRRVLHNCKNKPTVSGSMLLPPECSDRRSYLDMIGGSWNICLKVGDFSIGITSLHLDINIGIMPPPSRSWCGFVLDLYGSIHFISWSLRREIRHDVGGLVAQLPTFPPTFQQTPAQVQKLGLA